MTNIGLLITMIGVFGLIALYGATHGYNCRHRYAFLSKKTETKAFAVLGLCIPVGLAVQALSAYLR